MKIIELASSSAASYAGMVLAEQGHEVVKWASRKYERDYWLDAGKEIEQRPLSDLLHLQTHEIPDAVIEDYELSQLASNEVLPASLAEDYALIWVSLIREEEYSSLPSDEYVAGLWMAFKALSLFSEGDFGHYSVGLRGSIFKLEKNELIFPMPDLSTYTRALENLNHVNGRIKI